MSKKPQADEGEDCPLWKKDVSKVCHKCPLYVMLRGTSKNTGEPVDEWGCSIAWGPIMAVEVAQKVNGATVAIESFRNEMVEANRLGLSLTLEDGGGNNAGPINLTKEQSCADDISGIS